jgi:hypothetical protein
MNTLIDKITKAFYKDGYIWLVSEHGLELKFPIYDNPRLKNASPDQLSNIEVSPCGIHWPELDEDLSFSGILEGRFGQRKKVA